MAMVNIFPLVSADFRLIPSSIRNMFGLLAKRNQANQDSFGDFPHRWSPTRESLKNMTKRATHPNRGTRYKRISHPETPASWSLLTVWEIVGTTVTASQIHPKTPPSSTRPESRKRAVLIAAVTAAAIVKKSWVNQNSARRALPPEAH